MQPQSSVNEDSDKRESTEGNTAGSSQSRITKERFSAQPLSHEERPLDELLQLCLQLEQDALWTEFVRRSQPIIAGVIFKTVRRWINPSPSLVDDLVQDTYLKLCLNDFKALRQFVFRHENSLFGFLKVVASNTVHDHFRAVYSRKRGRGVTDIQLDCAGLTAVLNDSGSAGEQGILLEAIDSCLKVSACARDRVIFWLYYREGLTAKAISGLPLIRLSVKGVESTVRRLVRLVRLKLDSRYKRNANKIGICGQHCGGESLHFSNPQGTSR